MPQLVRGRHCSFFFFFMETKTLNVGLQESSGLGRRFILSQPLSLSQPYHQSHQRWLFDFKALRSDPAERSRGG